MSVEELQIFHASHAASQQRYVYRLTPQHLEAFHTSIAASQRHRIEQMSPCKRRGICFLAIRNVKVEVIYNTIFLEFILTLLFFLEYNLLLDSKLNYLTL